MVLKLHEKKPDDDVVRHLERLLAKAKEGSCTGIAYVSMEDDSQVTGSPGVWASFNETLGAIARLQHRIMMRLDEDIDEVDV